MGSFGKGRVDPDTNQTYHLKGDKSGIVEKAGKQVELSTSERRYAQLDGEVEVRRGNQVITFSCDDGVSEPEAQVVYEDRQ
jgi:hypothetical protein